MISGMKEPSRNLKISKWMGLSHCELKWIWKGKLLHLREEGDSFQRILYFPEGLPLRGGHAGGCKPCVTAALILLPEETETCPCLPKPTAGEDSRSGMLAVPDTSADGRGTERGGAGPCTQHLLPRSPCWRHVNPGYIMCRKQ